MTEEQAERLVRAVEAIAFCFKTCFLAAVLLLIFVSLFGTR